MDTERRLWTLGVTFVLLLRCIDVNSMTTTKSMSAMSRVNLPIYVNDSVIIELTEEILEEKSNKFLHCAVDVITDPSRRLLLHFLSLDISLDNRTPDRLHIYDYPNGGKAKKMTPVMGLFGVYDSYYKQTSPGVGDYKSSGNKLRLDYMGKPNLIYSGFRILITSFTDTRNEKCGRLYHTCGRAHICIPLSVMCDSEYNCGDGDLTDENTCHLVVDTEWKGAEATITAVIASGVAISIFIVIIIVVFCCLKKYNRRSYIRQHSVKMLAKRKQDGEWSLENNLDTLGVTEMYAPPTYEDAVSKEVTEEPPPAYDVVSTLTRIDPQRSPYTSVRSLERVTVVCIERPCGNDGADNPDNQPNEMICVEVPPTFEQCPNAHSCQENNAESSTNYNNNISENQQLVNINDENSSKTDECSQSSSSCNEQDSGTFAEESSQGSGSSPLEEDLISVTSDFHLSDEKCYKDKETCDKSVNQTADYTNRICLMNCDDIEYVDSIEDENGNNH